MYNVEFDDWSKMIIPLLVTGFNKYNFDETFFVSLIKFTMRVIACQ